MPRSFTNEERLCIARREAAYALFDTERRDECVQTLKELLWDPQMSRLERLKVNMIMVSAVDDWHEAERYRLEAERVYAEVRLLWPLGSPEANQYPKQEYILKATRADLDLLAQDQEESKPVSGHQAPDQTVDPTLPQSRSSTDLDHAIDRSSLPQIAAQIRPQLYQLEDELPGTSRSVDTDLSRKADTMRRSPIASEADTKAGGEEEGRGVTTATNDSPVKGS